MRARILLVLLSDAIFIMLDLDQPRHGFAGNDLIPMVQMRVRVTEEPGKPTLCQAVLAAGNDGGRMSCEYNAKPITHCMKIERRESMSMKNSLGLCFSAVAIAALMLIVGCAGIHQGRSVNTSGFLGDYGQLHEGGDGEALLVYVNPKVDLRRYGKIMMDPIKVYPSAKDSELSKLDKPELQKLIDYFDASIRSKLSDQFTFVNEAGPGVMHFRVALTEANSSNRPIDILSSVIPFGMAFSALKSAAIGKGSGIGETCMEFEAVDSITGERLGAAVDKQVGDKYTGKFDKFEEWRATQAAFDHWAERLKMRLAPPKPTNP
jgi:hypothetical protein